jgi:hypothetical protein
VVEDVAHAVATGATGLASVGPARAATAAHAAAPGRAAGGVHRRRFRPAGALHAARLFTGFLYGHLQDELQQRVPDPDETDDLLRLGLHRLPITQFPRLRSLATVLAAYDGAAELDEGLDIVIAGLCSQLLDRSPERDFGRRPRGGL